MRLPRSPHALTVAVVAGALSIGAAAFAATSTSGADPVRPVLPGHALFGLCTAYVASEQAHPINLSAVPFVNLLEAARTAGYDDATDDAAVRAYCGAGGAPQTTTTTTTVADL